MTNGHRPYIVQFPHCPRCGTETEVMPGESPFQPQWAPAPHVSAANEGGVTPLMPDPRIYIRCKQRGDHWGDGDNITYACDWTGSAKVTWLETPPANGYYGVAEFSPS